MKYADTLRVALIGLLVALPGVIAGVAYIGHEKTSCGAEYYASRGLPQPNVASVAVAERLCQRSAQRG